MGVNRAGANGVGEGPYVVIAQPTSAIQYLMQLNASAGLDYWHYNGTAWSTPLKITSAGNVTPGANGTQDLGSATARWSTVYTSDLSLNNGIGDWTIVEGEDDLFLYNNKKGKVYKFALTEVDPNVATPKKS